MFLLAQALTGGGAQSFLKNIIEINFRNNIETIVCSSDDTSHLKDFFVRYKVKFYNSPLKYQNNKIRLTLFNKSITMPFSEYMFWFYELASVLICFLKTRPNLCLVSNTIQSTQFGYLMLPLPVIYFIHSDPSLGCSSFKKKFLKIFTNKLTKNKIVTNSKFNRNRIECILGLSKEKISVVPNGIKLPNELFLTSERENIILTVGHFEAYKNVEVWLQVAICFIKKNPTFQFVWMGNGSLVNEYKTKIAKLNLNNSIKLIGYQADPQSYYKKAKLYFQPSLYETQGLSIIEAIGFCLPCVASNRGGIPETISHGLNGYLCDPTDINGFVNLMQILIEDKSLYQQFQKLGYENIKNKFSFEKNTKAIIDLYNFNQ